MMIDISFHDFVTYAFIGFIAQLIDSALGMAFGTLSSTLLLAFGFPPAALSATVHTAEIFSAGASALAHWKLKNIDMELVKKLCLPAMLGATLGVFAVVQMPPDLLKPWIASYFVVIGLVIVVKSLKPEFVHQLSVRTRLIGFLGGFFDAFGGAGWGEFTSSGLILKGKDVRMAVGSLNTVEFCITTIISTVFIVTVGFGQWMAVAALALGGMLAAPLGAWVCKRAKADALILAVGCAIVLLGLKSLLK